MSMWNWRRPDWGAATGRNACVGIAKQAGVVSSLRTEKKISVQGLLWQEALAQPVKWVYRCIEVARQEKLLIGG